MRNRKETEEAGEKSRYRRVFEGAGEKMGGKEIKEEEEEDFREQERISENGKRVRRI